MNTMPGFQHGAFQLGAFQQTLVHHLLPDDAMATVTGNPYLATVSASPDTATVTVTSDADHAEVT